MTEVDDLEIVRTFFERSEKGDLVVLFVIDGREYDNADAVRTAVREAVEYMQSRRIVGEHEAHYALAGEPKSDFPTWEDYKRRFGTDEGEG